MSPSAAAARRCRLDDGDRRDPDAGSWHLYHRASWCSPQFGKFRRNVGANWIDVTVSGGGETDVGSTTATGVTLTLDDATSITAASWYRRQFGQGIRRAGGATLDDVRSARRRDRCRSTTRPA